MNSVAWRNAFLLLFLLAAVGGWVSWQQGQEQQAALQATLAGCDEKVAATRQGAEERLALVQGQFTRYRAAAESGPQTSFVTFGLPISERPFLARLKVTWFANFKLQYELKPGETLLGGREVEEHHVQQLSTVSSAGFLLGRRSNSLFGLVQVPVDDPALRDQRDWLLVPPPKAEVEVPLFNPTPEYALTFAGIQVEVEARAGCVGPAAILHAWRTESFIALVIGCEAAPGGTDIPLFPYEGFGRWTRLTDREIAFPLMTPAGGVAMTWTVLNREYGEAGRVRTGIGMPASVAPTFLPFGTEAREPVLHSMIFQVNAETQVWLPFWAVRKQLASARESFDFDRVLGVPLPVVLSAAYDPALRAKILPSYQSLLNLNKEHALPDFSPVLASTAGGG